MVTLLSWEGHSGCYVVKDWVEQEEKQVYGYYNGSGQTSLLPSRTRVVAGRMERSKLIRDILERELGRFANGPDMGQERPRVIKAGLRRFLYPTCLSPFRLL